MGVGWRGSMCVWDGEEHVCVGWRGCMGVGWRGCMCVWDGGVHGYEMEGCMGTLVCARVNYTNTTLATYMSVEFSRNAFAKGLLQIFSCVTCEMIDDCRWSAVSLTGCLVVGQLLKLSAPVYACTFGSE